MSSWVSSLLQVCSRSRMMPARARDTRPMQTIARPALENARKEKKWTWAWGEMIPGTASDCLENPRTPRERPSHHVQIPEVVATSSGCKMTSGMAVPRADVRP
jgi:hypothetical protein